MSWLWSLLLQQPAACLLDPVQPGLVPAEPLGHVQLPALALGWLATCMSM